MSKEQLQAAVADAEKALAAAHQDLAAFIAAPEQNVFDSLDDATATIEERLLGQAGEDCQGRHNCGNEQYTQEFTVAGVRYMGTLKVEYNRYDKTYYYVDGHSFATEPLDTAEA